MNNKLIYRVLDGRMKTEISTKDIELIKSLEDDFVEVNNRFYSTFLKEKAKNSIESKKIFFEDEAFEFIKMKINEF